MLACLDRTQQGVKRDDGLAGSDLALKEPLHRHAALEVGVELGDRALLVLGELERQHAAVAPDELAGWAERRCDLGLALPAPPRQPDLQEEQLVESEPAPPHFRLTERARPVQRPECVDALGQSLVLLQVGRKGIRKRPRQCRADQLAHLLRGDVLAGRIDRSEVGRRFALADVEAAHVEAVPSLPAA